MLLILSYYLPKAVRNSTMLLCLWFCIAADNYFPSHSIMWNPHINKTVNNKANSKLGFIKRNLKSIPQSIKTYAYWSLVRPHLEYCCPVWPWDPYTTRNINHLEGVQHRAARFVVHNYSWETSGSTLASALSWPTLEQRRAEARLITMYTITNNLLDINPNQYLMPGHSQTRSNHPQTQIQTNINFPQLLQIQLLSMNNSPVEQTFF